MRNRLSLLRERAGLTQPELADKWQTTKTTIWRLENSQQPLSEKWIKLAKETFNCTVTDLFNEELDDDYSTTTPSDVTSLASNKRNSDWDEPVTGPGVALALDAVMKQYKEKLLTADEFKAAKAAILGLKK